ncbi:MAG: hypothetical protein WAR57_04280 [Candidatus Phosphoribacter sp.]|nr:hypothetical protein [Actinomycetales bacterium]
MSAQDRRFSGRITGIGSTSGVRLVVGHWDVSPFGAFADVMVEDASGRRTLLAPTDEIARFVSGTYEFDDVAVAPIDAAWSPPHERAGQPHTGGVCRVRTDRLELTVEVGGRSGVGRLLRLMPTALATAPWWCRAIDPVARRVMPGVRTAGSTGRGRSEFYGATDLRKIRAVHGSWDGADLGSIADVWPPARFGFSSVPRRPAMTTIVTTVRDRAAGEP